MTLIYSSEVPTIRPNYKSQKSTEMPQNKKVFSVQDKVGARIFI